MSRWVKIGIVGTGYLLAVGAGCVSSHSYNARMAAQPYDTSGGMYAAGEALSALGVFLGVALVPTVLGLWFLRRNRILWQGVALVSLAFAGVGLIAVLMWMVAPGTPRHPALVVLDLLGLAQLLGAPLWLLSFVLFAFFAPTPQARRMLVAAIGIEVVIGACAVFHWFLRGPRI